MLAKSLACLDTFSKAACPTTTPGTKRPADEEAATSEAARARPTHKRLLSKPDGRCAVRSALHGSSYPLPEGISDILADDSVKARGLIREVRTQAAQALKAAMEGDETLHMVVSADFPDEGSSRFSLPGPCETAR